MLIMLLMSLCDTMESSEYCSHIIDNEVELKTNHLLKALLSLASKADKQRVGSPLYCKSARECCFQLNTTALIFHRQTFMGLLEREGRTEQLEH